MVICGGMVTPLLPSPSLYMQVSCQQSMIQQSYEQHMHALCARMPIPFFPQDSFPFPLCFAGRRLTTALLTRETEEAPPRLLLQHRRPSCHGTPGKEDQRVWMLPPPPLSRRHSARRWQLKKGKMRRGGKGITRNAREKIGRTPPPPPPPPPPPGGRGGREGGRRLSRSEQYFYRTTLAAHCTTATTTTTTCSNNDSLLFSSSSPSFGKREEGGGPSPV